MTDTPPPKPDGELEAKLYAKRRLPFDAPKTPGAVEKAKRNPGLTAAAVLYGLAVIGCVALAGFMYLNQGHALLSVPVIAPLAGALWFVVRTVMVLGPNPYNIGSQDK